MQADPPDTSSAGEILIINPGSTSTKFAVGDASGTLTSRESLSHHPDELHQHDELWKNYPSRLKLCMEWAAGHIGRCSAVVAMGGLLRPVEGGVYRVNEKMVADARANLQGAHASNLGCELASDIATHYTCPAYVVDPVSVDEFEPLAYYSGHPIIRRRSLSHALNIHAAARRAADEFDLAIGHSSFVIGHLGGGISIAPVRNGRIIDVNDAASDGPFSAERSGGLPLQQFISHCCSGKLSEIELRSMVMGNGGLVAYLGTNSLIEVEKRVAHGDTVAREVYEAMAYQIAKEIGAMSTVAGGRIDAIILTGGMAKSAILV